MPRADGIIATPARFRYGEQRMRGSEFEHVARRVHRMAGDSFNCKHQGART